MHLKNRQFNQVKLWEHILLFVYKNVNIHVDDIQIKKNSLVRVIFTYSEHTSSCIFTCDDVHSNKWDRKTHQTCVYSVAGMILCY